MTFMLVNELSPSCIRAAAQVCANNRNRPAEFEELLKVNPTMWHEARRREKATQRVFNDHKRRAERRREEDRVDPSSFLQVHGVKAKLCLDPNVYKQATTSMVAWQGDSKIMIDRFDVRATLDSIPRDDSARSRAGTKQGSRSTGVLDVNESAPMRTLLNYERYRLLIQNDLHGIAEESRLNLVARSDMISDAKLRKLKGDKFGTSGETPSNDHLSHPRGPLVKEQSRRAASGATASYNCVPPPSSLSADTQDPSGSTNYQKAESPDLGPSVADHVIDLDDYDNTESDQVNIRENSEQTNDVARRYRLSGEELVLLSELDNRDATLKEAIDELRNLAKKTQLNDRVSQSQQDYGPALPPDLPPDTRSASQEEVAFVAREDSQADRSDSPVAQRSPSGAVIPMRRESQDKNHQSSDDAARDRSESRPTRSVGPPGPAEPIATREAHMKTEIPDSAHTQIKNGQTKSPPRSRRRASTPLAYKRNRRSSRSVSRERRMLRSTKERRRRSSSSSSSIDLSQSKKNRTQEDRSRLRSRHR